MLLTHEEMSHMRSLTAPDTFYLKWLLIRVEGLSARRFHTAAMYVGIPKNSWKVTNCSKDQVSTMHLEDHFAMRFTI